VTSENIRNIEKVCLATPMNDSLKYESVTCEMLNNIEIQLRQKKV